MYQGAPFICFIFSDILKTSFNEWKEVLYGKSMAVNLLYRMGIDQFILDYRGRFGLGSPGAGNDPPVMHDEVIG